MRAEQFKQETAQLRDNVAALTEYWSAMLDVPPPAHTVFAWWVKKFGRDIAVRGIDAYNVRHSKDQTAGVEVEHTTASAVRYISGTCWNIVREEPTNVLQFPPR
jgi:hypothetical protein